MSAILNEIESRKQRKCFVHKTTIFHHVANNFTNRAPLTINKCTLTSVLTSNMHHSFCKLYLCCLRVVTSHRWIKTRPAQKLVVQMKFTSNLYSYVCERPPLKYTQTRVCRNSYMGTRTCLLYTSPSPRDRQKSRMPSSA